VGIWEVCAGPNRSLLAWEVSSEWLTLIYCQLRLRLPAQMGADGRGSPKYPCHHDDIGRPSGGQQPRDLLGVPAVATVQESTQGSMRPMALIHISQAASIDRP